jgi:hypothetical protein
VSRVALVGGKPGLGRLQGGDRVDLPGPGGDGVPVSEYRVVPVAEQLSAVEVAMGRLVRELEARLPVARSGMLAASSVRSGGPARARAGRGIWITGRPAAGGSPGPGCDGAPGTSPSVPLPQRTSHRPALDGRQPPALASCSGWWSLCAAKVPVRGRSTAPGCHLGQDPDQPAGCPVGFQLGPAAGSHVRSAPHSTLTCENVRYCHLADVRSLAARQATKDQIRRPLNGL